MNAQIKINGFGLRADIKLDLSSLSSQMELLEALTLVLSSNYSSKALVCTTEAAELDKIGSQIDQLSEMKKQAHQAKAAKVKKSLKAHRTGCRVKKASPLCTIPSEDPVSFESCDTADPLSPVSDVPTPEAILADSDEEEDGEADSSLHMQTETDQDCVESDDDDEISHRPSFLLIQAEKEVPQRSLSSRFANASASFRQRLPCLRSSSKKVAPSFDTVMAQ
eukprot:TRINITY_DN4724_c1_g1_i1.p1 TRINITY_DN4724_c1_g1~~TRINITY_DN4724_c1_g1_i1.p1  ORF type:complete len:222 (-),score=54.30 TRINITY_DN4724_c1_g1_i1:619-1284(-)